MFQDDLKTGEKVERIVLNNIRKGNTPLFGEAFPNAYKVEGYFKGDPLYPSWVFNEEMWLYNAPVAYPDGEAEGKYMWDEPSVSWVLDPSYSE